MKKRLLSKQLLSMLLAFTLIIGCAPVSSFATTVDAAATHTSGDGVPNTISNDSSDVVPMDAETVSLDISSGNIIITATGYTYNGTTTSFVGNYTITGTSKDANTITVDGYAGNITLSNVNISHYRQAPVLIKGNSTVTVSINGDCVLSNGGTSSTNPYNWPALCVDSGTNKVTIAGTGTLNATGGKYAPGIGGAPSDEGTFVGARKSTYTSDIVIDGPQITARGGSGAPCIGTGRACDVQSGSITFKSGRVTATGNGMNACGIGLCESQSLESATVNPIGSFSTNLTLNFDGGSVTASGGSYGAAIGAGRGQNAYKVNISGSSITATGGSNSPAIGGGDKSTSIEEVNITGGTIEATAGSNAIAIGDGVNVTSPTSTIKISGGTLTVTSNVNNKSPIQGNVSVTDYVDLDLRLSYVGADESVRIPHKEYVEANYITSGYSNAEGTYYKEVAATPITASHGNTVKYVKMSKCLEHSYAFAPDPDDDTAHTRICIYCDNNASSEQHAYSYSTEGQVITEECSNCHVKHTLIAQDVTEPFDNAAHSARVISDGFVASYSVTYSSDGSTFVADEPVAAGSYTAKITVGDVSVTATLVIEQSGMTIQASNVDAVYDGENHCIAVTVVDPTDATVTFSTDGITYSREVPMFTDVGKHITYYKIEKENYSTVVGTRYVTITPQTITGIHISGVDAPVGGHPFDTEALCETPGVASTTPVIHWFNSSNIEVFGIADYETAYTARIIIYPNPTGYEIAAGMSVTDCTVEDVACDRIEYNGDKSITVHVNRQTSKPRITRIAPIEAIEGLPNGVEKTVAGLQLPTNIAVECDDPTVDKMSITWDLSNTLDTDYDPTLETEQTFRVQGTIEFPKSLDVSLVSDTVIANVQVLAATVQSIEVDHEPGIYTDPMTIHLTTAREGATIYYTLDGTDPDDTSTAYDNSTGILLDGQEGQRFTYQVKAIAMKPGLYSSPTVTLNYTVNMSDRTPPTAEISILSNVWDSFWSDVTFGLISSTKRVVTITYDDVGSGLADTQYYFISDHELTVAELRDTVVWDTYSGPFDLEDAGKYIIYAKAMDKEDNYTFVNSEGVVIYQNSLQDTAKVDVTPKVSETAEFYVSLNGNTIDSILLDGNVVDPAYYEINETTGQVILHHEAFDGLDYGDFTITVKYKAQGVDYVESEDNEAPIDTTLTLTMVKPKLLSITAPTAVNGISNGTALDAMVDYLPTTVAVVTEDADVTSMPVTWDTSQVASGSYDPASLESSSFTLSGTVQLDSDVQQNGVDLTVTIGVNVLAAGTCNMPEPTLEPGRWHQVIQVGLSSSDGADIYYTLDGSLPTKDTGTRYTSPIEITESTTIKAICVKAGLHDSSVLLATYYITDLDTTPPTGTIKIGAESLWDKFWNSIGWNFFTKSTQLVTIEGADVESGIKAVFYHLSDKELTADELEALSGWEKYEEPLHLSPNSGAIIYAKVVNGDNLYTYVNSNGIVVYTDAEAVTQEVTYVKGTQRDATFAVKLNGNTVKGISNGAVSLGASQFSQSASGAIAISAAYLESLSVGTHVLTISYNPYGKDASAVSGSSTLPNNTSIKLVISQASNNTSGSSGSSSSGSSVYYPSTTNPTNFEGGTDYKNTYYDAKGTKHEVVTTTYNDKTSKVVDTSTDKSGTVTVTTTSRDVKGVTTNISTRITTKDGTTSSVVTEYLPNKEVKTTENSVDKSGNSYHREYITYGDTSTKESVTSVNSDVKTTDSYKYNANGTFTQTYTTSLTVNKNPVSVTIKGSGSVSNPTYKETYTIDYAGTKSNTLKVTKTSSGVKTKGTTVKVNKAGNKATITSGYIDTLDTVVNLSNNDGKLLPAVSKNHVFNTGSRQVKGVDVTYKVTDSNGNKRYTLLFNTQDIIPGALIYKFRSTSSGNIMLGSSYTKVNSNGTLNITPSKNWTYLLVDKASYKKANKEIASTAKFSSTKELSLSKGKSCKLKMSKMYLTKNTKSVVYKSKNPLVVTVDSNGKVTSHLRGKTTVKATIKFVNGGSKTISRSIRVK